MGFLDSLQGNMQKINLNGSANKFDEQIAETDREINNVLTLIGRTYLEAHREAWDPEYEHAIRSVKELELQREVLERNKLAAENLRKCGHCQQVIPLDSAFCNKCGSKLEPVAPDSIGGKFCPSCGASLETGAAFCTSCGAKLN